jgi:CxxC motif-containing protein
MMEEQKNMICITCPKGCTLEVTQDGKTLVKVSGGCKRGHEYVEREMTDPRRMIASTVRISNALHPLMPVYTSAPFPKPRIPELLSELRSIEVKAPVRVGQVLVKNVLDTGIDILASRSAISIATGIKTIE